MTSATPDAVREALRNVVDPCSIATGVPICLEDMGLLKSVTVDESTARVELIVTSPLCLQIGLITKQIKITAGDVPGVKDVEVEVDTAAEWWPEMIADDAQRRLREVRPLPLIDVTPPAANR